MELQIDIDKLCERLLTNQPFLRSLSEKITSVSRANNAECLDSLIQQISSLLQSLIQQKLTNQLSALVDDNNRILQQIRFNFDRKSHKIIEGGSSVNTSFAQIHNIISQERKRVFDKSHESQVDKSLSIVEGIQSLSAKIQEMQKKIKALEDRYETNFKSLWNVLSMTQSAVFDHIKQNRTKSNKKTEKILQPQPTQTPQEKSFKGIPFLSSFWKS